jgi:flagellar hook-associated protein 2
MVLKVTATTTGAHGAYTYNASIAQRLAATVNQATDPINGNISLIISGRQASVKTMNKEIADYDVRLALRQSELQRQFSSLETALGSLKDMGNYLAGQIAGLPTGG